NTFLDALAHHRHTQNLPATSLAWGLWQQTSTITGQLADTDLNRLRRNGIAPMPTQDALALFDNALASGQPHLVTARVDRAALRAQAEAGALPALLRGIIGTRRKPASAAHGGDWTKRLAALPGNARYDAILSLVRREVADVLAHPVPGGVDPDRGFLDLGFDSLTAVQLRNRLAAVTGLRLGTTTVFDHPTATALARHLEDELAPATGSERVVLAELDRLEDSVQGMAGDVRLSVAQRLQELGARLAAKTNGAAAPAQRLDEASDEELFAFIDNEL
ncbi:beta-ketoacyl reductase, partial [Nonomuraea sp. NPDC002799]